MPFEFNPTHIPDIIRIEVRTFADGRGHFMETYRHSAFAEAGIAEIFVQDNLSHSKRGVLRGLHYQKHPAAQGKLVYALRGEVFDVAVDIRKGSPTYGQWVGTILSDRNPQMLYVPPGFAHGFCVLSPDADFVYKVTGEYAPDLERGIVWNDPDIGIKWPVSYPILSGRDAALPRFQDADNDFVYEGYLL